MSKKQPREHRSDERTKEEALRIAKGIQKPGQTKDQTKLIAQGIQKGISIYREKEKALSRERDKSRKKVLKEKENNHTEMLNNESLEQQNSLINKLTVILAIWGVILTTGLIVGSVTGFWELVIKP